MSEYINDNTSNTTNENQLTTGDRSPNTDSLLQDYLVISPSSSETKQIEQEQLASQLIEKLSYHDKVIFDIKQNNPYSLPLTQQNTILQQNLASQNDINDPVLIENTIKDIQERIKIAHSDGATYEDTKTLHKQIDILTSKLPVQHFKDRIDNVAKTNILPTGRQGIRSDPTNHTITGSGQSAHNQHGRGALPSNVGSGAGSRQHTTGVPAEWRGHSVIRSASTSQPTNSQSRPSVLDSGFALPMAFMRDTFPRFIPIGSSGIPVHDTVASQRGVTDNSKPISLAAWNIFSAAAVRSYYSTDSTHIQVTSKKTLMYDVWESSCTTEVAEPLVLTALSLVILSIAGKPIGTISMTSLLNGTPFKNMKTLTWVAEQCESSKMIEWRNEIPTLNFILTALTFISPTTFKKTYISPIHDYFDIKLVDYQVTHDSKHIRNLDTKFLVLTLSEYTYFLQDRNTMDNYTQTNKIKPDEFDNHIVIPCTTGMIGNEHFLTYVLCHVINPVLGAYEVDAKIVKPHEYSQTASNYAVKMIPYTCLVNTHSKPFVILVVTDCVNDRRGNLFMKIPSRDTASNSIVYTKKQIASVATLDTFSLQEEYQKWVKLHLVNASDGTKVFCELRGFPTLFSWFQEINGKGVFDSVFSLAIEMAFRAPIPKQLVRADAKNEGTDQTFNTFNFLLFNTKTLPNPGTDTFWDKIQYVNAPSWDTEEHRSKHAEIVTTQHLATISPLCLPPSITIEKISELVDHADITHTMQMNRADNIALIGMFGGLVVCEKDTQHNFNKSTNFHEFAICFATALNASMTAGLTNAGISLSSIWGTYLNNDTVERDITRIYRSIATRRLVVNRTEMKDILSHMNMGILCSDAEEKSRQKHYALSHYPMPWYLVKAFNVKFGIRLSEEITDEVSARPFTFDADRNLDMYHPINSIQSNNIVDSLNYVYKPAYFISNCHSYKAHGELLGVPIFPLAWTSTRIQSAMINGKINPNKSNYALSTATISIAESTEYWNRRRHMTYVYIPNKSLGLIEIQHLGYPDPITSWLADTWESLAPWLKVVAKTGFHILSGDAPGAVATLAEEALMPAANWVVGKLDNLFFH